MLLLTCIEILATPFLPRVQRKARIDLSDYYLGFPLHERPQCTDLLSRVLSYWPVTEPALLWPHGSAKLSPNPRKPLLTVATVTGPFFWNPHLRSRP